VEIDIKFARVWPYVLVPFLIEVASGFTMSFTHQIVLALPSITQGFGCPSVVSVPGLSGTAYDQKASQRPTSWRTYL
jgi:hypothetical protein